MFHHFCAVARRGLVFTLFGIFISQSSQASGYDFYGVVTHSSSEAVIPHGSQLLISLFTLNDVPETGEYSLGLGDIEHIGVSAFNNSDSFTWLAPVEVSARIEDGQLVELSYGRYSRVLPQMPVPTSVAVSESFPFLDKPKPEIIVGGGGGATTVNPTVVSGASFTLQRDGSWFYDVIAPFGAFHDRPEGVACPPIGMLASCSSFGYINARGIAVSAVPLPTAFWLLACALLTLVRQSILVRRK